MGTARSGQEAQLTCRNRTGADAGGAFPAGRQATDAPRGAANGTVVYWAGNEDSGYDLYAASVPEPASMGLLALAGAAMLGRRRRRYGIHAGS